MPKPLTPSQLREIYACLEEFYVLIGLASVRWTPKLEKLHARAIRLLLLAMGESVNPSPDE